MRTWHFATRNRPLHSHGPEGTCAFGMALTRRLMTSLPARRVLWKLRSWVEVNGRKWRSRPHSEGHGMTPEPLTHSALWLTPTSGQYCHFMRWPIGRQMHSNHVNWHLLSPDSSISISLWVHVYDTRDLAGVRISSLIAYIPSLPSLLISLLQSNYGWKISLQHALIHIQFFPLQADIAQKKIKGDRLEKPRFVPIFWSSDYPIVYLLIIHNLLHIKINIQKTQLQITAAYIYLKWKREWLTYR